MSPWEELDFKASSQKMVFSKLNLFLIKLVEHRAAMREVVSSTPAGPTLKVFK